MGSFIFLAKDLLNDFSIEHFQNSPEATVRVEDFDALMRRIGEALSREKG